MDDWEAANVEVAMACRGEPSHHILPVLGVLERPTRHYEIVVLCEAALLVLMERRRRLQLTPGFTEKRDVLAVVVDLHTWHEGVTDELVVPLRATPIEQRNVVLLP